MQITMSKDGVKRVSVTVPFRLGAYHLAGIWISNHEDWEDKERVLKEAKNLSFNKIMKEVKTALARKGDERWGYVIGDNDLNDLSVKVECIFDERFFSINLEGP